MNELSKEEKYCTAFEGMRCLAAGTLSQVAASVWQAVDEGLSVLIFDDQTGEAVEIDLRGTVKEVIARLEESTPAPELAAGSDSGGQRGPGRPKLGVIAREVTLLPRHWDWLVTQPGGASVALRKLVDEARKSSVEKDAVRQSQEAAFRFMSALAGNLPGFEEAIRALFAGQQRKFEEITAGWPPDVQKFAGKLARRSFIQ
jgi:uncharacterized protein